MRSLSLVSSRRVSPWIPTASECPAHSHTAMRCFTAQVTSTKTVKWYFSMSFQIVMMSLCVCWDGARSWNTSAYNEQKDIDMDVGSAFHSLPRMSLTMVFLGFQTSLLSEMTIIYSSPRWEHVSFLLHTWVQTPRYTWRWWSNGWC